MPILNEEALSSCKVGSHNDGAAPMAVEGDNGDNVSVSGSHGNHS